MSQWVLSADPFWQERLDRDGFAVVRGAFAEMEAQEMAADLETAFAAGADEASIRTRNARVYAVRNLLDLFPAAKQLWRRPILLDVLTETLGAAAGLVRGLFFDKPPEQSWSLPWHRDQTIAVADNRLPSELFRHPTHKAGIPHVEAPREVLESMLTLRIHLDSADEQNGALRVLPGSHRLLAEESPSEAATVCCAAGDVLLMRPLLLHCSGTVQGPTTRHRRVLHLEFAACAQLPDGFVWHCFEPVLH